MKKAFTLNELLIALAIIGIVLVVAVPLVVSHFSKKSEVVALQRTYTAVANAVKLLMIDERVKKLSNSSLYIKSSSDTVTNTAGAFIKKYFKVVDDCETETDSCFAASYKNLDNNAVKLPEKGEAYCASISTGASICVTPSKPDSTIPVTVLVDINGPAKPNIGGRDLFTFWIYVDGFVGDKISEDSIEVCRSNSYGSGCFNRIIKADWSMDY